jgi:hypothetical protein
MSASDNAKEQSGSATGAGARPRSRLAREIALTLLVKLVLILAIKFTFFNVPVAKTEVVERLDAVFASQPAAMGARAPSDPQRNKND